MKQIYTFYRKALHHVPAERYVPYSSQGEVCSKCVDLIRDGYTCIEGLCDASCTTDQCGKYTCTYCGRVYARVCACVDFVWVVVMFSYNMGVCIGVYRRGDIYMSSDIFTN